MGLSTTYTKTETDFLIQQLEKKTASGYRGDLNKTEAAPTEVGFYGLLETGVYANLGGIDAPVGKLNFASFDGTTWKLIATDIPNYVAPINNLTSTSTTEALSANQGKVLNETKLDKLIFDNNILPIADFPQLKELYITGSGIDLNKDYAITVFRRIDLGNGSFQYTFYLRNITDSTNVFTFDFTTSDLITSINSSSHNYRLGENFYLFRNNSKTSNATIYVYCILDWSSMPSSKNYGSNNILKKSIFNLAYSPTVKSFIDGNYLNKTTNKKVFTNNPELNKYIKELYIYGSGLDPLKTYTVSSLRYENRDLFPLFFRISDNNGLVVATTGGENYDKSIPYSTAGSNYNNSGVFVKYIIDWEAVGRGNEISVNNINYNDNQKIESIVTKEAFNIVNSPTIASIEELEKKNNLINVSKDYPLAVGAYYNLQSAINIVPTSSRKSSAMIAFINAEYEKYTLTVNTAPTASGTITLTFNGVVSTVAIDNLVDTTPTLVATKIRALSISGWTLSGTGASVIFTNNSTGEVLAPSISYGSTGITGSFSITNLGKAENQQTYQFSSGNINDWATTSKWKKLSTTDDVLKSETTLRTLFGEKYLQSSPDASDKLQELYITGSDIDTTKNYALSHLRKMSASGGNTQYTIYLRDLSTNTDVLKPDITANNIDTVLLSSDIHTQLGKNFYCFRNANKYSNATILLYIIIDWDKMDSGKNYGNNNPLKKSAFSIEYSPTIANYLQDLNISTNFKTDAFTNHPTVNKYLKELYIYGPGVDTNKQYIVSSITYNDRDNFPLYFRISDETGMVVGTIGGETYDKNIPYSTVGGNYNNSGVYVKYIVDWEAVGRGNAIEVSYYKNQKFPAIIRKNAFNIVNSPTISAVDSSKSGSSVILDSQMSSFAYDFPAESINKLSSEELIEDNIITDADGVPIISVEDDGSVNMPYGLKNLIIKGSLNGTFKLTIDESNDNSLNITKL